MSNAFNTSASFDANGSLIPGSVSQTFTPTQYSPAEISAINNAIGGPQTTSGPASTSFFNDPLNYDFGKYLDQATKALGIDPNFGLGSNVTNPITQTMQGASDTATGVSGLLKIITDLPRMLTMIIGLILLAGGIFMLKDNAIKLTKNLARG